MVASDGFTGLRDLYCRLWMEAEPKKKKETDTHWRCKNGKVWGAGLSCSVPHSVLSAVPSIGKLTSLSTMSDGNENK